MKPLGIQKIWWLLSGIFLCISADLQTSHAKGRGSSFKSSDSLRLQIHPRMSTPMGGKQFSGSSQQGCIHSNTRVGLLMRWQKIHGATSSSRPNHESMAPTLHTLMVSEEGQERCSGVHPSEIGFRKILEPSSQGSWWDGLIEI